MHSVGVVAAGPFGTSHEQAREPFAGVVGRLAAHAQR